MLQCLLCRRAQSAGVELSEESPADTVKMTKPKTFQAYLPNCHRTYSCSFQGSQGRAYLFNAVVNVGCGPAEERVLLTGLHAVADIYCENCRTTLGWKYPSSDLNLLGPPVESPTLAALPQLLPWQRRLPLLTPHPPPAWERPSGTAPVPMEKASELVISTSDSRTLQALHAHGHSSTGLQTQASVSQQLSGCFVDLETCH
ncbi:hypothetical protein MC885_000056 [Smutsia gigantea]|nr:hypothetical protein MC885_000056 [Smutsia gigantea]